MLGRYRMIGDRPNGSSGSLFDTGSRAGARCGGFHNQEACRKRPAESFFRLIYPLAWENDKRKCIMWAEAPSRRLKLSASNFPLDPSMTG